MKKYSLAVVMILVLVTFISAQHTVKFDYCQASILPSLTKSGARLDTPGKIPLKLNNKNFIIDKHGKTIEFNSVADFISFMGNYDWEFVQFFPANVSDGGLNILFKKELKAKVQGPPSEIKDNGGG